MPAPSLNLRDTTRFLIASTPVYLECPPPLAFGCSCRTEEPWLPLLARWSCIYKAAACRDRMESGAQARAQSSPVQPSPAFLSFTNSHLPAGAAPDGDRKHHPLTLTRGRPSVEDAQQYLPCQSRGVSWSTVRPSPGTIPPAQLSHAHALQLGWTPVSMRLPHTSSHLRRPHPATNRLPGSPHPSSY